LAAFAESETLPIGVDDGVGEEHHAPGVSAVAEVQGMFHLVDRLLGSPLQIKLLVRRLAVELL